MYGDATFLTPCDTGFRDAEALQTGARGQRLARLRRERGFIQVELAERTGLVQTLVSDYERGKLRLNADMILRFTTALDVSTDDLLQPASGLKPARKTSRRVLQRLERIEALPMHVQTTVLKSLDLMLKSVAPAKRALHHTTEAIR